MTVTPKSTPNRKSVKASQHTRSSQAKDFTGKKLLYLQATPDGSCAPNSLAIILTYYLHCNLYFNEHIYLDEFICVWNLYYLDNPKLQIQEATVSSDKLCQLHHVIKQNVNNSVACERLITPVLRLYTQIWWKQDPHGELSIKDCIFSGSCAVDIMQSKCFSDHILNAKQAIVEKSHVALPGAPSTGTDYPYPTPAGWFELSGMADIAQLLKLDIAYGLNANFTDHTIYGTYDADDSFSAELKTWLYHSQECPVNVVNEFFDQQRNNYRRVFWQLDRSFSAKGEVRTQNDTLLAAVVNRAGKHFDPALPDFVNYKLSPLRKKSVTAFIDESPTVDIALFCEREAVQRTLFLSQSDCDDQISASHDLSGGYLPMQNLSPVLSIFSHDNGTFAAHTKDRPRDWLQKIRTMFFEHLLRLGCILGTLVNYFDPDFRLILAVAFISGVQSLLTASSLSSWLPSGIITLAMGGSAFMMYYTSFSPIQQPKHDDWIAEKSRPMLTLLSKAWDYFSRVIPALVLITTFVFSPILAVINMLLSALERISRSNERHVKILTLDCQQSTVPAVSLMQYAKRYLVPDVDVSLSSATNKKPLLNDNTQDVDYRTFDHLGK